PASGGSRARGPRRRPRAAGGAAVGIRKATAAPAGYDERADIGIVAEDVCSRLARGRSVRRTLPPVGSVVIEAHAPFLLVYRSPVDHSDAGAKDLVTTEAAYLFAAGEPEHAPGLQAFCSRLATQQRDKLGASLLLGVWTGDVGGRSPGGSALPRAAFRVNHDGRLGECVRIWQRALDKIRFGDG